MQRLLLNIATACLPIALCAQTISPYSVTDQLGYRPTAKKIAILRDPVQGHDAASGYTPGASYTLVDATTSNPVLSGNAVSWNARATDVVSGDKVWRFDFSSHTAPGRYYVLDVTNNLVV